ncbi:MAG: hypothetical protein QGI21_04185 [Candidatus Poseidoniaceae archaeon]|jgi:hypothetical protein|nr:hypothetical protein [Candidatus Poseidoniaceae archaeon]
MLQRILADFSAISGVDQAYIVSKRDGLVAAVGAKRNLPNLDHAQKLVRAMENLDAKTDFGRGLEFWSERGSTMYLCRISEDASIILSGKKDGQIARWRHAVDCNLTMVLAAMR